MEDGKEKKWRPKKEDESTTEDTESTEEAVASFRRWTTTRLVNPRTGS
jgi:hypothetical protein